MYEDLKELLVILVDVIIPLVLALVFIIVTCSLIFDRVPTLITNDGKEIFCGRSYRFTSDTRGNKTEVIIKRKYPFQLFPEKYYVGDNIIIEPNDRCK